jgi:hypothetical protein
LERWQLDDRFHETGGHGTDDWARHHVCGFFVCHCLNEELHLPRRGRRYAKLAFDIDVPPKTTTRRNGWVVAGKIGITFAKIIIAIPLTAIFLAAVSLLYLLFTLPS